MKKILSVLLTICIIAASLSVGAVVAFAAGTKIDGTDVTWSYNSDTKVLTFGGEGAIPDYNEYKNSQGDVSLKYPWKNLAYTSIEFGKKITGIGNYAFCYSKSLKEVTIPETVAIMGKGIFLNCTKLTKAVIETSATAIKTNTFAGCTALKTVSVASGPKTIDSKAFYGCSELSAIKIPDGVTSIGEEAFSMCIGLKTAELSDTVKSVGNYAFYSCEALTSLKLGKKLQKIGENAFDSCCVLEDVVIPDSVSIISDGAFSGCSLLMNVTLSDGLTTVGDKAFNLCPLLKEVTIGANVSEIGSMAFGYGKRGVKIDGFTISGYEDTEAQKYAASNEFKFVSLGHYLYGDCGEDAKWEFDPSTGTLKITGTGAIQNYTYDNPPAYKRFADKIKKITFASTITEIGNYAFYNISPSGMTVPTTITKIGTKAIGQFSSGELKEGFTIKGYAYSAAQDYAIEMKMGFDNLTPYEGSCGENVTWRFYEETGTLRISGTGAMDDCGQTILKEYRKYGFDVKTVFVEEGITYIGNYAFVFQNPVEEIKFGKGVEKVGKNAFGYISKVVDGENKLIKDTEIKVYGYKATDVKRYSDEKNLKFIPLDPPEIPDFELDASIPAKLDRENKVIYLYQAEMTSAEFMEKFPSELFDSAELSTEVIGTGSVLKLAVKELTEEYMIYVMGDIDGDGILNSMDSLDILNHAVEIQILEGSARVAADINGDGEINSADALAVLQISVGQSELSSFMKAE